jgi:DNA-binding response OmpR family regulator
MARSVSEHSIAQSEGGYSRYKPLFHVLVVDDEPIFRKLVTAVLRPHGFMVQGVDCGQSALECIEQRSDFALILLDISIPEGSGFYVLEKLRKHKKRRGFSICMVSGRSDPFAISRAMAFGADDYFVKGLDHELIVEKVRSLILPDDYSPQYNPIHPAVEAVCYYTKGKEVPLTVTGVSRLGFLLQSGVAWSLHTHMKFYCPSFAALFGLSEELPLKVRFSTAQKRGPGDYEIATEIVGLSPLISQKMDQIISHYQTLEYQS